MTTPKQFLYFWMPYEYLFRRYTLYDPHYLTRCFGWDTLDQKMYMVLISSNFYKLYLVSLTDSYTRLFQRLFYLLGKYLPTVFCRADDVI